MCVKIFIEITQTVPFIALLPLRYTYSILNIVMNKQIVKNRN